MLYSVFGQLFLKGENFAVIETAGLGLKIFVANRTLKSLPPAGTNVKLFCYLYLRENGLELYGFLNQDEQKFFELLNSVTGIGPKSALSVLEVADLKSLQAAIQVNRIDLFTKASGVGKKTAERIILELRGRVKIEPAEETIRKMETDADLVDALANLGYPRQEIKNALSQVDEKISKSEERLRAALKILTRR